MAKITTREAKSSSKALTKETFKLDPSSLVYLYELDLGDIMVDNQIINAKTDQNIEERVLRFHNCRPFAGHKKSIIWKKDQYYPAPFRMAGFESTMQGSIPKPRMGIAVDDASVNALTIFKNQIRKLDDLVGAKITRFKTFAKFLDYENFLGSQPPQGFDPSVKAEFPREIYYIERKATENKYVIEFELASMLDVEGVRLPRRIILSERCPWSYRGEGCCYEYAKRKTDIHGDVNISAGFMAPPVATELGYEIRNIIGKPVGDFTNRKKWNDVTAYVKGDFVYVTKNDINYYFVAKKVVPADNKPPNSDYWVGDECSKDIAGCKLRFSLEQNPTANGALPFGGFPSAEKQRGL